MILYQFSESKSNYIPKNISPKWNFEILKNKNCVHDLFSLFPNVILLSRPVLKAVLHHHLHRNWDVSHHCKCNFKAVMWSQIWYWDLNKLKCNRTAYKKIFKTEVSNTFNKLLNIFLIYSSFYIGTIFIIFWKVEIKYLTAGPWFLILINLRIWPLKCH